MSRILPLPAEAISQLHSSKHITSLQGAILSLLENSLDAGSSKVEIAVDYRRGACIVEDNGLGIPTNEFQPHGGLGRMYYTSKRDPGRDADLHGSCGTYLASLAALSLLSITSRCAGHDEHATLTIHQGKVTTRQIPAPPSHEIPLSTSTGTRVIVRDLFGNMPVRVKQRALAADAGIEDERSWQELKRSVAALLLAWPKPCSVRLRDSRVESRALLLHGNHPTVVSALTEKSLNALTGKKARFDLADALPVLYQAGFAPPESRRTWVPISASTAVLSIRGAICSDPVPTKQCQFISIGIRPCSAASGVSDLYDAVNKVFNNSSFGCVQDDSDKDDAEIERRKYDRRYKAHGYTGKQLCARKGVDRWPMFAVQISFREERHRPLDVASMNVATLKAIEDVLEAVMTQWLATNHLRPRKRRRRKREDQQSPAPPSSSERASSAESVPLFRAEDSTATTPVDERTVSKQSVSTSKKRKHLDVTRRSHALDSERPASAQSSLFNIASRIKSGRDSFYDDIWQVRKPYMVPSVKLRPEPSDIARTPKSVFNLPALEIGELDPVRRSSKAAGAASPQVCGESTIFSMNARWRPGSSDDFSSIDDQAALAAAETVEQAAAGDVGPDLASAGGTSTSNPQNAEVMGDLVLDWVNPVTKQAFKVNARTGVVLPARPRTAYDGSKSVVGESAAERQSAAINTAVSSTGKPLSLTRRSASSTAHTAHGWLSGFLNQWNNPVFARQDEERIRVASLTGPGVEISETMAKQCTHNERANALAGSGSSVASSLSKAALKTARVIKQVDRKFILCKTKTVDSNAGSETLVLVDQHAASERIILERLYDELCVAGHLNEARSRSAVSIVDLEKTLRFQISHAEYQLFQDRVAHFERWGILYELRQSQSEQSASQVRPPTDEYTIVICSLPPVIAERCTLSPKLLIELLRTEVWTVTESARALKPREHNNDEASDGGFEEHSWLKKIGTCPQGIIEMLNSRACRSAIMFNDELSVEQCEELLASVSRCAFPFVCAHGRVSMIPVVKVGSLNGDGSGCGLFDSHQESSSRFSSAFKSWRPDIIVDNHDMISH